MIGHGSLIYKQDMLLLVHYYYYYFISFISLSFSFQNTVGARHVIGTPRPNVASKNMAKQHLTVGLAR